MLFFQGDLSDISAVEATMLVGPHWKRKYLRPTSKSIWLWEYTPWMEFMNRRMSGTRARKIFKARVGRMPFNTSAQTAPVNKEIH